MTNQSPSPKNKSFAFKDHPMWLIATFMVVTILGNGAYWKWKETEITTVLKTTELRKAQSEIYAKIIDLSSEYSATRDAYSLSQSRDTQKYNKMIALKNQLELIKSDFLVLEKQLANLENRNARAIQLELILPPPPTNIRLVQ